MEPATQGAPGTFVWEAPGQPAVIHVRLDVVDRIAAEILRGFGALPKRGAEVGGVLVGVITDSTAPGEVITIRIDDFEPVPCKYVRGPSYLPNEYERMLFEEVCERRSPKNAGHTCAVGYYRSHTRDGLALEPEDIALLDQYFPLPAQVALLVKPFADKPSVAGFFLRKNGVFPTATPLAFPFSRWAMTGEEPPPRPALPDKQATADPARRHERIFSAEPDRSAEPNQAPAEQPEPQGQRRPKSRAGMWMVAAFVFLLLGVLLGYEASRITAPRRASDFALSLAVERAGQNLTVHWNPSALAVRSASSGVLEIDDSGETKRVDLDRANLSNGSLVYRNGSDKVRFRLVVYLDSGLSVTEELGWTR